MTSHHPLTDRWALVCVQTRLLRQACGYHCNAHKHSRLSKHHCNVHKPCARAVSKNNDPAPWVCDAQSSNWNTPYAGHENNGTQPKADTCPSSTSHFSLFNCAVLWLEKGVTPKICMCFVLIRTVLFNLSCVCMLCCLFPMPKWAGGAVWLKTRSIWPPISVAVHFKAKDCKGADLHLQWRCWGAETWCPGSRDAQCHRWNRTGAASWSCVWTAPTQRLCGPPVCPLARSGLHAQHK